MITEVTGPTPSPRRAPVPGQVRRAAFTVTNVQRNSDTNFPNQGSSVWAGSQSVGGGTSIQIPAGAGSGNQFWISFTTDGGVNTSRIRVPTSTVSC